MTGPSGLPSPSESKSESESESASAFASALALASAGASASASISDLVPHAGPMSLLESVIDWDGERIRCGAVVALDHPLRTGGRLPATALIEYAAQAMAAHGRLVGAAEPPRPGRLVGLRSTELGCRWVDATRLVISATRLGGDDASVLYRFDVMADDAGPRPLASGRAIVMLAAR